MSDYDPNRMDPKRPGEAGYGATRGYNWNWIIGGVAALVVLIVALSFMGNSDQTADTGEPPAATTGQATPPAKTTPSPAATSPNPAPTTPPPANPKQ